MTKINLKKQPGVRWNLAVEAGSDKATSTLVYTDNFEGWMGRCPDLRSAHPDIGGMSLVKVEADRIEGGQVQVTLSYESWSGQFGQSNTKLYEMEVTTSEEHILTHPRYQSLNSTEKEALLNISNGTEADEKGQKYESRVTSDSGKEALGKIRKGITQYLVPSIIWTEKYNSPTLSIQPGDIGTIDTPPGGAPTASGRNWLYIGATASLSQDGKTWQITRQWRLSGRNRWDTDLYNS